VNTITKIAIKEAFGTNPKDAIAVKVNPVLCMHHSNAGFYIPDGEIPTPTGLNDKVIHLKQYRYGDSVAIIGYCHECENTYYVE